MNADPKLKPDIAALKKRLSEDPGFAAQVKGEQAAMRPELALFFRDLRNHLLHVIDMSKGEHYLDVVRLNAQALIQRMELHAAAWLGGGNHAGLDGCERVRRHARLWRDNDGLLETVETVGNLTCVIRGPGYVRPGSIACQVQDTGNGFIVHFPGHGSCDMDHCLSLDYAQARELVLALSPHSKELGFAA